MSSRCARILENRPAKTQWKFAFPVVAQLNDSDSIGCGGRGGGSGGYAAARTRLGGGNESPVVMKAAQGKSAAFDPAAAVCETTEGMIMRREVRK